MQVVCRACNETCGAEWKFCDRCGRKLEVESQPTTTTVQKKKRKKKNGAWYWGDSFKPGSSSLSRRQETEIKDTSTTTTSNPVGVIWGNSVSPIQQDQVLPNVMLPIELATEKRTLAGLQELTHVAPTITAYKEREAAVQERINYLVSQQQTIDDTTST